MGHVSTGLLLERQTKTPEIRIDGSMVMNASSPRRKQFRMAKRIYLVAQRVGARTGKPGLRLMILLSMEPLKGPSGGSSGLTPQSEHSEPGDSSRCAALSECSKSSPNIKLLIHPHEEKGELGREIAGRCKSSHRPASSCDLASFAAIQNWVLLRMSTPSFVFYSDW